MLGDMVAFLNQEHWAVVGVSNNTEKYGYKVYHQLKKAGYSVYAVNPKLEQIEGDPCYPDLGSLPHIPDAVSVVVPPKVTEQIIDECANLGIHKIWMQPGSESAAAIKKGDDNNLELIYNQCVLKQTRDRLK